jgi:RHS repeat-associated protein
MNTNLNIQNYRYGFNGMEKDDAVKGAGNSYDFGARMYDARIGRWLAIDPLFMRFTSTSPYNFVLNSPLMFLDPDGQIVTFANKRTKRYYDRLSKAAKNNPQLKARLEKLEASEIEYNIKIKKWGRGGVTKYNFNKKRLELNIKDEGDYTFGLLGDELVHAEQFEDGDIGYMSDGFSTTVVGYDLEDEIDSKIGAVEAIDAINKEEGKELKLSDLKKYPSSAALSKLLEDND